MFTPPSTTTQQVSVTIHHHGNQTISFRLGEVHIGRLCYVPSLLEAGWPDDDRPWVVRFGEAARSAARFPSQDEALDYVKLMTGIDLRAD